MLERGVTDGQRAQTLLHKSGSTGEVAASADVQAVGIGGGLDVAVVIVALCPHRHVHNQGFWRN